MVNERLKKPEFDCSKLDEKYDCGCGDDKKTHTSSVSSLVATYTPAPGMVRGG
jgi:FAD-linked sulfhydryl oxidase